jgi:hypothetical protein
MLIFKTSAISNIIKLEDTIPPELSKQERGLDSQICSRTSTNLMESCSYKLPQKNHPIRYLFRRFEYLKNSLKVGIC